MGVVRDEGKKEYHVIAHTPACCLSFLPAVSFHLCYRCWCSDERCPERFKAPLDARGRRLIDAVQRLELLRAELVVSNAVLPVEGLCGCTNNTKHFNLIYMWLCGVSG